MQTLKRASVLKFTTHFFFSLLAAVALFSCSKDNADGPAVEISDAPPAISSNASDRTSTVAVPYDNTVYVPCANGGAGEYVHLNGRTNFLYTISWTDHGFTYGYHANSYAIKGVGLTSGEQFVASGTTEGQVAASWVNERWIAIITDQLRVTAPNTSFVVKNKYHVTTTPDGDALINLREQEVECK